MHDLDVLATYTYARLYQAVQASGRFQPAGAQPAPEHRSLLNRRQTVQRIKN